MTTCRIEPNRDDVRIEGQVVKRPDYVPRSDWLRFWENYGSQPEQRCPTCGDADELGALSE